MARTVVEYDASTRTTRINGRPGAEPYGYAGALATARLYAWMGHDVTVRARGLVSCAR